MKQASNLINFLKQVYRIWTIERPTQLAAALAYYAIFALAPMIFIASSIAGIFINNLALIERAFAQLEETLGSEVVQAVRDLLASTSIDLPESMARWTWISSVIGFLALLWAASGLFTQIHFALNRLWGLPAAPAGRSSGMIRQRALSVAMVILLGLLLVVVSVLNLFFAWIDSLIDVPGDYSLILSLAFIGLVALCFAIIYKYIPDVHVRWRDVWLGAVVAAVLESVGILMIGLLLRLGAFSSAAAAAGSFAMLLVILYYMAQIFLIGAIITRVYTSRKTSQSKLTDPQP